MFPLRILLITHTILLNGNFSTAIIWVVYFLTKWLFPLTIRLPLENNFCCNLQRICKHRLFGKKHSGNLGNKPYVLPYSYIDWVNTIVLSFRAFCFTGINVQPSLRVNNIDATLNSSLRFCFAKRITKTFTHFLHIYNSAHVHIT